MKITEVASHSEGESLHKIPTPTIICIICIEDSLLLKYALWT